MLPMLQRGRTWREFERRRAEADAIIYETIDERRGAHNGDGGSDGDDVLAMLLEARHEDGSPMSPVELRDELMTLLVAGHETTASELAWAFERLARTPAVFARLTEEIDSGDDDAYVTATVQETLRRRPVLPNAAPRLAMEPVEIGGWTLPGGRLPARGRVPDPPRPGRSIPTPTPSGPSASSTSGPAPTPGSRSAAAAAAASARASPSSR